MAVEIDEARLKQLSDAEALLGKLYANKETKRDLERIAKKVNPNAVTTEDLAAPYLSPLDERIKKLEDFQQNINKGQNEWQENESFNRLRQAGYTDTGVEEIKKLMADRKINDPEIAAAYWDKTRPAEPVAPNGISPSMWNFENSLQDNEEDMKLLLKNDDAWLDRQAARFFNDKR